MYQASPSPMADEAVLHGPPLAGRQIHGREGDGSERSGGQARAVRRGGRPRRGGDRTGRRRLEVGCGPVRVGWRGTRLRRLGVVPHRSRRPGETSRVARAEDAPRAAAEAVLVGAGAASLLAVVFTPPQTGNAGAPARGLLIALAMGSVALAWLWVHTVRGARPDTGGPCCAPGDPRDSPARRPAS